MEDKQKNSKWKTTKKRFKMEDKKKFKMEDKKKSTNEQLNSIQFKNKIVQIGCGSTPGNLVE